MPGLWSRDPETSEGKYPIVLRRDGTPLESEYFVMVLKDPAVAAALSAYADAAANLGYDHRYVDDVRDLSRRAERLATEDAGKTADPPAPRHRTDDPVTIAWARSIGRPAT